MIQRLRYRAKVEKALGRSPVTALLGPRQCGKTTLADLIASTRPSHYFDLESPRDQLRLQNPEMALSRLDGLVIIDEIQTMPELFPVLRVLADNRMGKVTFLILGSASPTLIKKSSESLAGRIEYIDLHGFDLSETGWSGWRTSWTRGGFPRSFLAPSEDDSEAWREGLLRTFLERDLPQLGLTLPAPAMRRFWTMLAHLHGQIWNASEIGRSMGLSDKTVRRYLDILTQTYMVRQLPSWFENIGKRQVKAPKIYIRDSGLLHSLLGVPGENELQGHPKVGASWEGFALEQVIRNLSVADSYFWSTYSGAELDLLFSRKGKRYGFEFKYTESPTITRSMWIAMRDLSLEHLWVICPGAEMVPVNDQMTLCGIERIGELDSMLGS